MPNSSMVSFCVTLNKPKTGGKFRTICTSKITRKHRNWCVKCNGFGVKQVLKMFWRECKHCNGSGFEPTTQTGEV